MVMSLVIPLLNTMKSGSVHEIYTVENVRSILKQKSPIVNLAG